MAHTSSNSEAINASRGRSSDEVKPTNTSNSKGTIFHDFLGKGCCAAPAETSPSPAVGPATGGGVGKQLQAEASPSAGSVSIGGGSSAGGGLAPLSTTSDLGSERHVGDHFEGVPFYGPRGLCTGPSTSSKFSGNKRSNSDFFMGTSREKLPSVLRPESLDNSHLMKLLRNAGGEHPRRPHDEDTSFGMHQVRPISGSVISPSIAGRPDATSSKWDRAIPVNIGPVLQYPPRAGQVPFGYLTHQNKSRDASASPSVISQAAADEGSRTGIKGSGILSSINASAGALERNFSGVLAGGTPPKSGAHGTEPESSNTPSRHELASSGRQMTIFYGGQAHVFDNVHPNKADVIMALAGSNGGSWSTTYAPKSASRFASGENCTPGAENETGTISGYAIAQESLGKSLVRVNSVHGPGSTERIPTSKGIHQGVIMSKEVKASIQAANASGKERRGEL